MSDNPSAFPLAVPGDCVTQPDYGMTLRDWFAGRRSLPTAHTRTRHAVVLKLHTNLPTPCSLPARKATQHDPNTLDALAVRCEQAGGPDRALDVEIGLTDRFFMAEPRWPGAEPMIGYIDGDGARVEPGSGAQDRLVPAYTASLDAAMQLVPEGCFHGFLVDGDEDGFIACCQFAGPEQSPPELLWTKAATPALALTAAALRARARASLIRGEAK